MKRITDYNKVLPINELYTAVQAEGSRAGYATIVVRTVGCTHRCWFGEGGWCDAWANSIHPEKGKYTFQDIINIYDLNPHIKEMMLTGGSPTMHPALVNELTHFAHERGIFITMETEGSHFLETDFPINLLSISPKFSNSIPHTGISTPAGDIVDEKMVKQHNKFRLNYDAMSKSIVYHSNYHLKPVWDGEDQEALSEILNCIRVLDVPQDKVYFMPAGDTREALLNSYPKVMNWIRDNGYKFTGRPHIIAFDDQREV
ncbi:MAG TPA: 7-carboxy-7-deazaguanine synthase QueE [Candidatus Absconditabacterales bacterium]|nr:7-carboxy-7-deazaguanine synthase QueE [Candidatus Absconditabacterales bacterium]